MFFIEEKGEIQSSKGGENSVKLPPRICRAINNDKIFVASCRVFCFLYEARPLLYEAVNFESLGGTTIDCSNEFFCVFHTD